MKRTLCLLLALALLSGCVPHSPGSNEIPVTFYYIAENLDYFSDTGILGADARILREEQNSVEAMLELYLAGPVRQDLSSPFPPGLRLIRAERGQGEITLVFDDSLAELSGIRLQIACACIARTVSEFENDAYETVHLCAEHLPLENDRERISVRPFDLVLVDHSAGQSTTVLQLYFSDLNSRFLVGKPDNFTVGESADMAEVIVNRLIRGPEDDSLRPTIPEGTVLQSRVSVVERVCVVNFSGAFVQNQPKTSLAERMTVFSVVNSLAQLDEVDEVEIRVEGQKLGRYLYLDLSDELQPDERMIGPVRSGIGEFDATLYVCLEDSGKLAPFPVRIRESADTNRVSLVLDELCGFAECNGYYSPAKELVEAHEVQEENGALLVLLTADTSDESQLHLLTRSLTATLRELSGGRKIRLFINGEEVPADSDPFDNDWILP
jgi:germination protein M